MEKKNIKNIITIVVVIVVIFFAYTFFVKGNKEPDALVSTSSATVAGSPVVRELFKILDQLSELSLDTSIFEDPLYKSLEDYGVTIDPQPIGRSNPFKEFE